MDKIKIIVATHKKYRMPNGKIYLPVHVGADGKKSIGFVKDSTGDNISSKNPSFCELTGLYWAWKNLDANYIGLSHYRRHFTVNTICKFLAKDKFKYVLSDEEAIDLLEKYDIILPAKRRYYIETLYSHYAHTHYAAHLDETRNIISVFYPEYINSYDKIINKRSGYMFNMMVMKKMYFDMYCEWLFTILFELEKRVGEKNKDLSSFQSRFYGRVSEIIFNVWLDYQLQSGVISSKKIKSIGCIHMEKLNWIKKGSAFIKSKLFGKKYEGSF